LLAIVHTLIDRNRRQAGDSIEGGDRATAKLQRILGAFYGCFGDRE
jgi:hypothetical protein